MLKRVPAFQMPPDIVGFTALASFGAATLGLLQGWPLWARALAALLPWIPLFTEKTWWIYIHYQWLSLFYVLVVTQVGHFLEHVAQMIQIHILGLTGPGARGVFGTLDLEWVHFVWNTWVIVAVLLLLQRFRTNPWLWLTALVAGWHEIEHLAIMSVYFATGKAGTPGLLAHGGLVGGGLPLSRPDLHFLYNLVETIPLVAAFIYAWGYAWRGEGGKLMLHPASRNWLVMAFFATIIALIFASSGRFHVLLTPQGVYKLDVWTGTTVLIRGSEEEKVRTVQDPSLEPGEVRVANANCLKSQVGPEIMIGSYRKPISDVAIVAGTIAAKNASRKTSAKNAGGDLQLRRMCEAEMAIYLVRTQFGFNAAKGLNDVSGAVPEGWTVTFEKQSQMPVFQVAYSYRKDNENRGWAWEVTVDSEWGDHIIKKVVENSALGR